MKIPMQFKLVGFALTLLLAVGVQSLPAEDAYYSVPLSELTITSGQAPSPETTLTRVPTPFIANYTRILIDGAGEGYLDDLTIDETNANQRFWNNQFIEPRNARIVVCAPAGSAVTGKLVWREDSSGEAKPMSCVFSVPAAKASPDARKLFIQAKADYYQAHLSGELNGAAWFRHQMNLAKDELGTTETARQNQWEQDEWRRMNEMERTYALVSGGRAVAENLQLDRVLPETSPGEESVNLDSIAGITVAEMDWKAQLGDAKPALDLLAAVIPADQHALFFPNFAALTAMIDEAQRYGTPILEAMAAGNRDEGTHDFYQQQLCLPLTQASRLFGPAVIQSVAITGGDPYFRTGTDVAVIFETQTPDALVQFIKTNQAAALSLRPDAKPYKGDGADGGLATDDRAICSYFKAGKNMVIVSNSLAQLKRLAAAQSGAAPAMASSLEYQWFRVRYPRGESETALLVLTDATIRRWCGPQWRIATSRRTRAMAALAELQAQHMPDIVAGSAKAGAIEAKIIPPDAGAVTLDKGGARSSVYGTLDFLTPISETPLAKVTQAEAAAYSRWRDNYQRNWRQVFDPIAVRFIVAPGSVEGDMTILPLIANTEYREMIQLSQGARIKPGTGDPHAGTPLHISFAVNLGSQMFKQFSDFSVQMAPGINANPFNWMGETVAVYADDDPLWQQIKTAEDPDDFLEEVWKQIPVGFYAQVKNPLALATFLTSLRGMMNQTAPGMVVWENQTHGGVTYVKVGANPAQMPDEELRDMAVYYATLPGALVISLNEGVVKRAIERLGAPPADAPKPDAEAAAANVPAPWLGENLNIRADRSVLDFIQVMSHDNYNSRLQRLSWANLPILNEWKRLYPGQDPVALHEQVWGARLICPAGGEYVWNEEWKTMESTVAGHPVASKPMNVFPSAMQSIKSGDFGLTIEGEGATQGLRTRAKIFRETTN